jgi:phospholipid/cholesterol/gamma-HCH transport system substrate-binding protein
VNLPGTLARRLAAAPRLPGHRKRWLAGAAAVVAAAAAVSAAGIARSGPPGKELTAYFPSATGLYAGDRVQVFGVPVGAVTAVTPQPGRVRVEMTYDPGVQIPAGAEAAIVTPTLVTTRAVQLTPAYRGSGPVLASGAVISEPHTAVPVEWDQIETELNTLSTALGPKGPGRGGPASGALNAALNTAAANLKGNGQTMHDTLDQLSAASRTLSDNRGDLFGTLSNLQQFIAVLRQSDGQVGTFEQRLADVSGVLHDNDQGIARTLAALHSSLGTVTTFVAANRTALAGNLATLNDVTGNLNRSDQTIADILQFAPTQVANLNNIYNPIDHSITGALASSPFQDPAEFICATVFDVGGTGSQCQQAIAPLVSVLRSSNIPVSVDPVNRGGFSGQTRPSGSAPPAAGPDSAGSGSATGGSAGSGSSGSGSSGNSGLLQILSGGGGA